MTDETSLQRLTRATLDAFTTRGLALVDVTCEARDRQRVRLDLAGQRLHLVLAGAAPGTFVLGLREARTDAPGHARINARDDARFEARDDPPLHAPNMGQEDAPDAMAGTAAAANVLVSVHFSTPLFETSATHWHAAFELGLDALLYAAARLQHELELADYHLAGPLDPI